MNPAFLIPRKRGLGILPIVVASCGTNASAAAAANTSSVVRRRPRCFTSLPRSLPFPLLCFPAAPQQQQQQQNSHYTLSHNYNGLFHLQQRWSSKKRRKQAALTAADAKDPFSVLGVSRTQTFVSVKRAFLQIAMKHHPDTTAATATTAERDANKTVFVEARKAFEAMVACPEGLAILKTEAADYVEEEDGLDDWFKAETGYDMPFMDAATMKEVAEMTETVGGGLDRDGGMWTLARMVADTVKSGGDGRSLLQLDAGVIRDRTIDGVLRRKRRR